MKIFIAVPTFETIFPDTFKSIYGQKRNGHWHVFDFIRGYDCAVARNNIAKQTGREQADYVLMVDSDVVLPSDAVSNLMEHDEDVVLGYCALRNAANIYDSRVNVYKMYQEEGIPYFSYPRDSSYTAGEMMDLRDEGEYKVQVHGGGMACALIKARVFERLEYPWFKYVNYKNGAVLSEDLYFCEQCKKAGIPIYVDTRVGCGHILRHAQWPV